jgi:hypothetical protein
MARYLVVAHQTAGSPELRQRAEEIAREDRSAEFAVLVPATPVQHLFTWEDGETMEIARRNVESARRLLEEAGLTVVRTAIGSRSPADAIDDEIREHPGYDALIICTLPSGVSRWLKLDLLHQAGRRTGLPVMHVVAEPVKAAAR